MIISMTPSGTLETTTLDEVGTIVVRNNNNEPIAIFVQDDVSKTIWNIDATDPEFHPTLKKLGIDS